MSISRDLAAGKATCIALAKIAEHAFSNDGSVISNDWGGGGGASDFASVIAEE